MKVLIAGAGIGGLFAGIALKHAGHDVVVAERHPEVRPAGAGITLWANGLKLLDRYGLLEDTLANAGVVRASEFRDMAGRTLVHVSLAELVAMFGQPTICMHREDLSNVLLAGLGREHIALGKAVESFEDTGKQVLVRFADGTEDSCDVLVGADGIHSAVRRQLFPGAMPRYDGQVVWRGVVNAPPGLEDAVAFVAFGRGSRAGWSPMGRGRLYWFGSRFQPEGAPEDPAGMKTELLKEFGHWAHPIPGLIDATDPAELLRNDVYYVQPLPEWGRGRVTLLGDAAHATPPQVAQGACLAMEDAAVLALRLGDGFAPEADLRRYEAERRPRAAKVFNEAQRVGKLAAMTGPVSHRVRNFAMRVTPSKALMKAFAEPASYEIPV